MCNNSRGLVLVVLGLSGSYFHRGIIPLLQNQGHLLWKAGKGGKGLKHCGTRVV